MQNVSQNSILTLTNFRMTTEDRWTQLKKIARQQLYVVDKPTFLESFIEYECEPSFQPIFNLQIIWTDKSAKWRYAEWNVDADRSKFYELDGKTKVVLSQPDPTIKVKSGIARPELLTHIIIHIRQLKISPRIDRLTMFTLDGNTSTVSLGTDDLRTTYSWHTLPDEWKDLEKLVDMLLDVQKLLEQP